MPLATNTVLGPLAVKTYRELLTRQSDLFASKWCVLDAAGSPRCAGVPAGRCIVAAGATHNTEPDVPAVSVPRSRKAARSTYDGAAEHYSGFEPVHVGGFVRRVDTSRLLTRLEAFLRKVRRQRAVDSPPRRLRFLGSTAGAPPALARAAS
jgi:hypothetical protein